MKLSKIPILKNIASTYLYKTLPDMVKCLGYEFYLQKNNSLSLDLARRGIFEKPITQYMQKTVQSGDYVVDVGANIGYYSFMTLT